MNLYYALCFFVLGTILGSFYNVVGYRIPKGESIVSPPSHCPNCNHRLKFWELLPILSFIFQRGKCTSCKQKISLFYPIFESSCGLVFALAYLSFGFSWELLIALTFISMLIIVMVSDYIYMVIPDEILLFFGIILSVEILFIHGYQDLLISLGNGCIACLFIYFLKMVGDLLFKKESMGGGDIKLLFIFGLVLGWQLSVFSIFLASVIGLPLSIIILYKSKDHIIPFGPFLSIGTMIILLTRIDLNWLLNLLIK